MADIDTNYSEETKDSGISTDLSSGSNGEKKSNKALFATILAFVNFNSGLVLSLYGPLFPQLAKEKHVPLWLYSLVFGAYYIIILIVIPLIALILRHVKSKFVLFTGTFVIGSCAFLFGSLEWCPDGISFIIMTISVRAVDGFGAALVHVTSYVIVSIIFISDSWKVFMWMQSFQCVGFIIGSIAGTVSLEAYNFSLPFYFCGALTLIGAVCVISILPISDEQQINLPWNFFPLLKQIPNLIYFFSLFVTSVYVGFLEPILQPYLNQFNLSAVMLGLFFTAAVASYLLTAPVWGWLDVKGFNGVLLIAVCNLLVACSIILISPTSFFHTDRPLSYIIGALVLTGTGTGGQFVCSFSSAFNDALAKGFLNDISSRYLIFELFMCSMVIGRFIGSSLSGFLYDSLGLHITIFIFLALEILPIPFLFVYAFKRNYKRYVHLAETSEETTHILERNQSS